jgi:thiol-disulfide isomerase/thioredoxin
MRGGKTKKSKSTSRSVMGRLLPPVDIREEAQLGELEKRIAKGPLTLVLVYADWCGHCQRFKPMMEELESCPNRSVQTARIRDDMLPKSSISSAKIEGYPTLMLVKKSGEVATFKTPEGEVTNAIPEHTNMQKMTSLVRTAGTEEGLNLLSGKEPSNAILNIKKTNTIQAQSNAAVNPETPVPSIPKNIVADRLPSNSVTALNTNLVETKNTSLKNATAPIASNTPAVPVAVKQAGGSLWSQLMIASQAVAPAAALFLGAEAVRSKKKSRKTRRRKSKGRK